MAECLANFNAGIAHGRQHHQNAHGASAGSPYCRPHACTHCGEQVDSLATQGLSCRWSEGCHHRKAELNDIMERAFTSTKVPACLEPSGLNRADGRRLDGVTIVHLCTLLVYHQCHQ